MAFNIQLRFWTILCFVSTRVSELAVSALQASSDLYNHVWKRRISFQIAHVVWFDLCVCWYLESVMGLQISTAFGINSQDLDFCCLLQQGPSVADSFGRREMEANELDCHHNFNLVLISAITSWLLVSETRLVNSWDKHISLVQDIVWRNDLHSFNMLHILSRCFKSNEVTILMLEVQPLNYVQYAARDWIMRTVRPVSWHTRESSLASGWETLPVKVCEVAETCLTSEPSQYMAQHLTLIACGVWYWSIDQWITM